MSNGVENRAWPGGSGSRVFFAGFLIVAGTLLFLGNLGILPIRHIWLYWPLVLAGFGLSKIVNGPDLAMRLFGCLFTFLGGLFLLINFEVIHIRSHDGSWPISILLIAGGATMLIKLVQKPNPNKPMWAQFRRPISVSGPGNELNDFTLMGSIKRRFDASDFRGGNALCVLGNIELDLRHSDISPGQTITLEVSAILGAAKIRVPEHWRVQIHGASILGTYEDKTVPANSTPDSPGLVITGYSFMSSIEVED
jgi:predicted membrane protein